MPSFSDINDSVYMRCLLPVATEISKAIASKFLPFQFRGRRSILLFLAQTRVLFQVAMKFVGLILSYNRVRSPGLLFMRQ